MLDISLPQFVSVARAWIRTQACRRATCSDKTGQTSNHSVSLRWPSNYTTHSSAKRTFTAPPALPMAVPWRLELFFSSIPQLQQQVPFLRAHGISRVNLPNKAPEDDLHAAVRLLRREIPGLDICCHFSCKNQRQKTREAGLDRLYQMCHVLQTSATSQGLQQHEDSGALEAAGAGAAAAAEPAEHAASKQERKRVRLSGPAPQVATRARAGQATAQPGNQASLAPASRQPASTSSSILIVSGGGKKSKQFETLTVLQSIQHHGLHQAAVSERPSPAPNLPALQPMPAAHRRNARPPATNQNLPSLVGARTSKQKHGTEEPQPDAPVHVEPGVQITVAYNPYLPDAAQQELERSRLEAKLATGHVSGIYLQIGSDVARLETALQQVRTAVEHACQAQQAGTGSHQIAILGSILIPSKQLLARMKFRPWSGVFLSEQYLSSVESAEDITHQVLQTYARHGVVPLFETAVKTDTELQRLFKFLAVYDAQAASLSGCDSGQFVGRK